MKEIKFRAWDKNAQKMLAWEEIEGWDIVGYILSEAEYVPMQYTGLKDKNGKEIYESDIIKAHGIGFSTTSSEIYFGCDGAQVEIGDRLIQLSNFREREIMGNKYEKKST